MALSRTDFETDLAAALSRHIGYTTGAYEIHRIADITTVFQYRPSIYQYELVQHLVSKSVGLRRPIHEKYATEIINFAVALGLLYKAADGPSAGAKRFALTPEGITVRSALVRNEDALSRFSLIGLVLESDCDAYGLLLDILHEKSISGAELHRVFLDRFEALRRERLTWLDSAIPNRMLRDRIHEKMSWILQHGRTRPLSPDFARHHVTPRLGWAQWFGHIELEWTSYTASERSPLTQRGVELLCALRGSESRYTWLGPQIGTQEALDIPESLQRGGPWAPSWNLLRPAHFRQSEGDIDRIADEVAEFMGSHYTDLKLVHANQASIESVIPYLHLKEYELGYSVESNMVFDRLFGKAASFSFLSSRRDKYRYFQRANR